MPNNKQDDFITFWQWFRKGSGGKRGVFRLLNWWLCLDYFIGAFLARICESSPSDIATKAILPLIGALIGLTFAWVGNAQALLQSKEIIELSKFNKGGYVEYPYCYQIALLAVITSLILWGFAGLGIFDLPQSESNIASFAKAILFGFVSLSIRESWGIINNAHFQLQTQYLMKTHKEK